MNLHPNISLLFATWLMWPYVAMAQDPGNLMIVVSDTDLTVNFVDEGQVTVPRGTKVRLTEYAPNYFICFYHSRATQFPVDMLLSMEEAQIHFAELCQSNPSADNYAIKSSIEDHLGNSQQALEDAQQALILDEHNHRARLSRAVLLYGMKDYVAAESDLDELLSAENIDVETLAYSNSVKASILAQRNEHAEGLEYINKAIEINPHLSLLHANQGYFLRSVGEMDEAKKSFEHSTGVDPSAPHGYFRLGYSHYAADEFDKAKPLLLKAAELDPRHHYSQIYLAYVAQAEDDSGEYARRMILAAKARQASESTIYGCAWMLATHPNEEFRDGKQAREFALKLVERANSDRLRANALTALAAAYAELEEFELAIDTVDKIEEGQGNTNHIQGVRESIENREPYRDDTFTIR